MSSLEARAPSKGQQWSFERTRGFTARRGMATSIPPVRRVCSCTQPQRNYLAQKKGWGAMLLLNLCPTLNLQHSGVLEEEKNTRFYKLGMDFLLGIGA